MSAREFLRELAKLQGRFVIERGGGIRRQARPISCPITAVAEAKGLGTYCTFQWYWAGKKLGLKPSTAQAIARAADRPDAKRRPYLLKALGLTEPRS